AVRRLLYDQAARPGPGAGDQSPDYRGARWPAVGHAQHRPRGDLSADAARGWGAGVLRAPGTGKPLSRGRAVWSAPYGAHSGWKALRGGPLLTRDRARRGRGRRLGVGHLQVADPTRIPLRSSQVRLPLWPQERWHLGRSWYVPHQNIVQVLGGLLIIFLACTSPVPSSSLF